MGPMRTRAVVIAAVVGVLLLAGAGAVYAYDHAHAEEIGEGVRVGGVDVLGAQPERARAKLAQRRARPAEPPGRRARARQALHADPRAGRRHGRRRRLRERRAGALARRQHPRAGPGATLRGEPVDAEIELDISYSKRAIRQLVKRVARGRRRGSRSTRSVDLESGDVTPQASKDGRRLLAAKLKRQVRKRLLDVGDAKTVRAQVKVVKPEVTTAELAEKYPAIVIVNRADFKLTLYKELKPVKTYGIAVGQVGLETPAGLYHIQNKAMNPAWNVPNSAWAGDLAGTVSPAACRRTRSRRAGWASTTAPASTAPTPIDRSAPPHRTAASGCGSPT